MTNTTRTKQQTTSNMENLGGNTIICECGEKTINEAIVIFQNTSLPYKKAKKLVTGCSKSCCRLPLMELFNMVYIGKIDIDEIVRLKQVSLNKFDSMLENFKA